MTTTKEQQRAELHKTIWSIAEDLRGSIDGWDFKQYVLNTLFYRFISENLSNYLAELEGDPNKAARADAWQTAIGLQAVDRLEVSEYLIDTAKQNIEARSMRRRLASASRLTTRSVMSVESTKRIPKRRISSLSVLRSFSWMEGFNSLLPRF